MTEDKRKVLFIGGLPARVNEAALQRHFERYSPVERVRIVRERISRESKGYAFVNFEDPLVLPFILSQDQYIFGRKVDCQAAARKCEKKIMMDDQKQRRIFVVNIPAEVDNKSLHARFSEFGKVRNAYVIRDFKTKVSRTYGYVEFFSSDSAIQALNSPVWIGDHLVGCYFVSGKDEQMTVLSSLAQDAPAVSHLQPTVNKYTNSTRLQAQVQSSRSHETCLISRSDDSIKLSIDADRVSDLKPSGCINKPSSNNFRNIAHANESPSNYRFNVCKPQTAIIESHDSVESTNIVGLHTRFTCGSRLPCRSQRQ